MKREKPTLPRSEKRLIAKRVVAIVLVILVFAASLVSSELLKDRRNASEDDPIVRPLPVEEEPEQDEDLPGVLAALLTKNLPPFSVEKFSLIERTVRAYSVYPITNAEAVADEIAARYLEAHAGKIDETDPAEVTDALLHEFLRGIGDRYAYYRTADEYEQHTTDMEGNFYGIGVYVQVDYAENTILVLRVYEGSPAEAAGILAGDFLITVDGKSVSEIGPEAAVNMVRGKEGTEVSLTVLRGTEELSFVATRSPIEERNASYTLDGDVAVIGITEFKANTAKQFKDALDAAKEDGVRGIVFDVRNNPGGYLDSVALVLSYLVPDGTPVALFGDYMPPLFADDFLEEDAVLTVPCAVLCNGYTASAGELFTSAIRDYATEDFDVLSAVTVGQKTFGKGIMQSSWLFSDGSAVTLTVSFYNPPSNENYHEVGITPGVIAEDDPATPEDEELTAAKNALRVLIEAAQNEE